MKILIVGSGGREHALAWKIAQDTKVTQVFVAPGNAGTATEAKCVNVQLDILDNPAIIAFAKENNVEKCANRSYFRLAGQKKDDHRIVLFITSTAASKMLGCHPTKLT